VQLGPAQVGVEDVRIYMRFDHARYCTERKNMVDGDEVDDVKQNLSR
jgi:hypothetical protein